MGSPCTPFARRDNTYACPTHAFARMRDSAAIIAGAAAPAAVGQAMGDVSDRSMSMAF